MTDKELLERAAKAAGIEVYGWPTDDPTCLCLRGTTISWNPLTDDGDALRLAVKLGFNVAPYSYFSERCQKPATVKRSGGGKTKDLIVCFPTYKESFEKYDPYAATRRAIVRAAAEIGKEME